MEPNLVIGQNLRRIRMERGLSLGQLAAESCLSKMALSQIERGEANPTINTIWKIASGLKVPYTELMFEQPCEAAVVSEDTAPVQTEQDGAYRSFTFYTMSNGRPFDWFVVRLARGAEHVSEGHPAGSEEYVYVVQGRLTLKEENAILTLKTGESCHFGGKQRHVYVSCGETELICISIIVY